MDAANYLNFAPVNPGMRIYRYIRLERLYQLFGDRENVLVHPSKWDDPFENFILNAMAKSSDGSLHEYGIRHRVYGQCWTTGAVSDALWRIYCPRENGKVDGVRIRTTVKRLADSLTRRMRGGDARCSFIGRVRYLPQTKLFHFANTVFATEHSPKTVAETLLVKRRAFRHETEVRLIHRKLFGEPTPDNLLRYSVDPHSLIDQIMIDPRVAKSDMAALKREIRERTGFKGLMRSSLLYRRPEGLSFPGGF